MWKRTPLGSIHPPLRKWCNFPGNILFSGHENALSKTHLSPSCLFPLGQYTELKRGLGGKHFLGPAHYMYSLIFLFGYKIISVNFKCVMIFFPLHVFMVTRFRGKETIRIKWDQKSQTQKQLVSNILHSLLSCKEIQMKIRKLFKLANIKRLGRHW